LAKAYAQAGASAMSVLTDEKFFQGHLSYIQMAKQAAGGNIPVLRKDFIIDPYQVWQARAYGADAILLIMANLEDAQATQLQTLAKELALSVLVEVHNAPELERALAIGAELIGINNRNLHTFEVDLATTETLVAKIPAGKTVVSESGISSQQDIAWLAGLGVHAALIGETLMRAATTPQGLDTAGIGQKVREMFL
jgi:indole-3-glycerol phosphate synthase